MEWIILVVVLLGAGAMFYVWPSGGDPGKGGTHGTGADA